MKKTNPLFSLLASLTIAMMSACPSVASASDKADCNKESHYPLITKSELKAVAEGKSAFIVDVNSKESFESGHVPTAIHYGSHEKDFMNMLPKDKNAMIVAYCGGPACTAWKMAAKEACKAGYTNIRHFKEGIQGWNASK